MLTPNDVILAELAAVADRLEQEDQLLSRSRLEAYFAAFRRRFGPVALCGLDGEGLLQTLHGGVETESLSYWLEFKNDVEFPAQFGSIGGGSAFKFGLFFHKGRASWVTGSPQRPEEVSQARAVEIARIQRDELCHCAALVSEFPATTDDSEYQQLQRNLAAIAPTIYGSAWTHKYLSLLFPGKIDGFHSPEHQRFHLVRLLEVPPPGLAEWPPQGRYLAAGRFVALAQALRRPLNQVVQAVSARNGRMPYPYYRVGMAEGTLGRSQWRTMRAEGCVALSWPQMGDLAPVHALPDAGARRETLKRLLNQHYPRPAGEGDRANGRLAGQISVFLQDMPPGAIVVAIHEGQALGIGRVTGKYRFQEGAPFPHMRGAEWLSDEVWTLPRRESAHAAFRPLYRYAENLVEIERRIHGRPPLPLAPRNAPDMANAPAPPPPRPPVPALTGVPAQIAGVLTRKKQVILYGPPGTGKTYWAEKAARELAARSWFDLAFDALSENDQATINAHAVRLCSFHPSYGYEDFLEGYRPDTSGGEMVFQRRDGLFKRLCYEAEAQPGQDFFLIIDEINRGDIPRIFGELLTVMEAGKRGKNVLLPLSGTPFRVPPNVYILGTMNTADRSIALLDAALRRRFGFLERMPDSAVLGSVALGGVPLGPWLDALNESLMAKVGREGRHLQIGHAYLLTEEGRPLATLGDLAQVLAEDIIPLLQDYCDEDYAVLEAILGPGLIDAQRQRVRTELFAWDRADDLATALLAPFPEIAAGVPPADEPDLEEDDDEQLPADPAAPAGMVPLS